MTLLRIAKMPPSESVVLEGDALAEFKADMARLCPAVCLDDIIRVDVSAVNPQTDLREYGFCVL